MPLRLKLEAMPGDIVLTTCREMCETARRLGLTVEVRFNDVTLVARPGADPDALGIAYEKALKQEPPRMAFA